MGELSEIAKELNLPKQLIDKGEAVIKAVLGPSIKEFSETLGDSFRLRRFKNQVKILTKAQEYLKEQNINPKEIELKLLAPLVEYSSLEEDELLQEKWSKLITNIVSIEGKTLLKQNSIDILKKLANEDALLIDYLHKRYLRKRQDRFEKDQKNEWITNRKRLEEYPISWFSFSLKEISGERKKTRAEIELTISNLVALGLIKWEPEVYVGDARKTSQDPNDDSLDIDIEVYDDETVRLTNLGIEFVELCKLKNE